jgi:hypothetical protein
MPYAIDKPAENLSLAEMTEVAIAVLSAQDKPGPGPKRFEHLKKNRDNGFFLMVEGGKIDWACHANDAMAVIGDMLDFDDAVGVALEFYRRHPRETLIIVTGDHETGGMTIGHATTAYKAYYERLLDQKHSFTHFGQNQWKAHKDTVTGGYSWEAQNNLAGNTEMIALMADAFGLRWEELNEYSKNGWKTPTTCPSQAGTRTAAPKTPCSTATMSRSSSPSPMCSTSAPASAGPPMPTRACRCRVCPGPGGRAVRRVLRQHRHRQKNRQGAERAPVPAHREIVRL